MTGGRAAGAVLTWMLLLFTLAAVIFSLAGNGSLLAGKMLEHAPAAVTGLPETEYPGMGQMIAGYLTGREAVFQYTLTGGDGVQRECFHDYEAAHMADCRGLIHLAGSLRWVFGGIALALLGLGALRPALRKPMAEGMLTGLWIFLAAAAALAVWGLLDFDSLFRAFHRLMFTNDGWLLDPRTDLLIRLMPVSFFTELAVRCLVWLLGAALLILTAAEFVRIKERAKSGERRSGPETGRKV